MIQANELRIGDYLKNDGVVVKIDARSIFDIWDDKGLKNYEPIPITEGWLLKFGFKIQSINDRIFYSLDGIILFPDDVGGYYMQLGKGFDVYTDKVHHLQNLYYLVRGKELELE